MSLLFTTTLTPASSLTLPATARRSRGPGIPVRSGVRSVPPPLDLPLISVVRKFEGTKHKLGRAPGVVVQRGGVADRRGRVLALGLRRRQRVARLVVVGEPVGPGLAVGGGGVARDAGARLARRARPRARRRVVVAGRRRPRPRRLVVVVAVVVVVRVVVVASAAAAAAAALAAVVRRRRRRRRGYLAGADGHVSRRPVPVLRGGLVVRDRAGAGDRRVARVARALVRPRARVHVSGYAEAVVGVAERRGRDRERRRRRRPRYVGIL